jgi:uncharacterized membrane protein
MGYVEATLIFITGLIAFTVLLPVANQLLPTIGDTMGGEVVTMISAMFVIILAVGFMIYIRQAQQPDQYMGVGGDRGY